MLIFMQLDTYIDQVVALMLLLNVNLIFFSYLFEIFYFVLVGASSIKHFLFIYNFRSFL
jgi:hypothetical protein